MKALPGITPPPAVGSLPVPAGFVGTGVFAFAAGVRSATAIAERMSRRTARMQPMIGDSLALFKAYEPMPA